MTWVRRNRLGLILLPVALALAVAASSSRLMTFWYPFGPHDVTSVGVGEKAHLTQEWMDRAGTWTREVTVTVDSVEPTTVVRDYDNHDVDATIPKGTKLMRVSMSLAAKPDQVLRSCSLVIIDTQGREYPFSTGHIKPSSAKSDACQNPGEGGPEAALVRGKGHVDEEPRPETWSSVADVLMAADAKPATVQIWWDTPEAIEVRLTP